MLVDTPPPWCIDTANLSLQHWKTRTLSLASVWENATTTTFRAHHVHPGKLTCWMIFLCKEGWFLGSMTIRSFSGGYHIFKAANRLIWFLSKLCRAKLWLFRSVGVPSTETASFQPRSSPDSLRPFSPRGKGKIVANCTAPEMHQPVSGAKYHSLPNRSTKDLYS